MADQNDNLAEFKTELRSVLTAQKDGIPIQYVNKEYKELIGEDIKFREYNFNNLEDFLLSLNDVCYLERSEYKTIVKPILTEKQAHIAELVGHQKEKKYSKKFKFPRSRGGFSNRFNKFSISGRKSYPRNLPNGNSFNGLSVRRDFRDNTRNGLFERKNQNDHRSSESRRRSREISLDDIERRESRKRRFSDDFKPSRSNSPAFDYKRTKVNDDNFRRRERSSDRRRSRSRERSSRRNNRSPRRDHRSRERSKSRERSSRRNNRSPRRDHRSRERSSRRNNRSPRRDHRSRERSKSRERSIRKDDNRNKSVNKSVDNLDNKVNNKIKDLSTMKNGFVDLIKSYLDSNIGNNSKSTNNSTTTLKTQKIVSYDIRAKNNKDDSFKIKIIDNSATNNSSNINKTHSNENSDLITDNNYNKFNNNNTNFDNDYMDICSESSSSSKIIEDNKNKPTEEIQKQEIRDPRLIKRAERINLNNNLKSDENKLKSEMNTQDNDDDDDIKELLYDSRFSKIKDYSPERYKKKLNSIQKNQNDNNGNDDDIIINSRFEYADTDSSNYNYDDYEMNISANDMLYNDSNLPLINYQSLRSFSKFLDSSTNNSNLIERNVIPNVFESNYEMNNESEDSLTANTLPIDFNKYSIEFEDDQPLPKPDEPVILTRISVLKIISAIPNSFIESTNADFSLISSSKNNLSKNELTEIIRSGGLDKVKLDSKVNYKIELKKFIKKYKLPDPIYETFFYGEDHSVSSYVSSLIIGDKKWYCILRFCDTNGDVENHVSKKALDELNETINKDNNLNNVDFKKSNSLESDFISKIIKLFNNKDEMMFSNILETKFKNAYTEELASNWLEIVEASKCLELKKNMVNDNTFYSVALRDNLIDNKIDNN